MGVSVVRPELVPSARGAVWIWQEPRPGFSYCAGIDCSGGGSAGDWAVNALVEAESCDLVAMWRDKQHPIPWGRSCALLGAYYNGALLAFETGVSGHGQSAAHSCIAAGYDNLYKQQNMRRADVPMSESLGWATTATTKPMMYARVQEALAQNYDIPSEELLREVSEQKYDLDTRNAVTGSAKIVGGKNDDIFMAYAIALLVRDRAWTSGLVKGGPKAPQPMDESARYWARIEQQQSAMARRRRMWGRLAV